MLEEKTSAHERCPFTMLTSAALYQCQLPAGHDGNHRVAVIDKTLAPFFGLTHHGSSEGRTLSTDDRPTAKP